MSIAELKKKLIDRIQETSDQELLMEALWLLEMQLDETEEAFTLTEDMDGAIKESKEQFGKANL